MTTLFIHIRQGRLAMSVGNIRIGGANLLNNFGVILEKLRIYPYEIFIDEVLKCISLILRANRVSFFRHDGDGGRWVLIASTLMRMPGFYGHDDVPLDDLQDGKWFLSPRSGIGFDAFLVFKLPFAESCYYGLGIDDTGRSRNYRKNTSVLNAIARFIAGVIALRSSLDSGRRESRELRERVHADVLTGMPNRRAWEERIGKDVLEGKHVIILDIDHFKRVNDTSGHAVGDEVLRRFAGAILSVCERFEGNFFARFGGEEFIGILTGDREEIEAFISRLREEVSGMQGLVPWKLTFSAGICEFVSEMAPSRAVEAADFALYEAKRAGRDRHRWVNNIKAMSDPMGLSGSKMAKILCA